MAAMTDLWPGRERIVWTASTAAGLAACAVGWWTASGRPTLDTQLELAAWSVVGLAMAAAGQMRWVLRAREVVRQRQVDVLGGLTATKESAPAGGPDGPVVAGAGLTRYHRPSCPLARDRGFTALSPSEQSSLRPCGVCRP